MNALFIIKNILCNFVTFSVSNISCKDEKFFLEHKQVKWSATKLGFLESQMPHYTVTFLHKQSVRLNECLISNLRTMFILKISNILCPQNLNTMHHLSHKVNVSVSLDSLY